MANRTAKKGAQWVHFPHVLNCCVQLSVDSNNEIRKLLVDSNVASAYKGTPKPLLQHFPILTWEANAI